MEDYKANQLLNNELNHLSKFKRKHCVEINDDKRRTCNTNNQIKLKAIMIKQNMWKYCDAYISFTEIITVANSANNANKKLTLKNYALFIDSISKIANANV